MRHKDATQPLVWDLLMRHTDANQSVKATWLGSPQGCSANAPQGCKPSQVWSLGWALLMRHKDANQSVKATWLASADAPQGFKPC